MSTFGVDFVMEPLVGDRPNGTERIPHVFVVIAERDNSLERKIYFFVENYVPSRPKPAAARWSS